MIVKMKVLEKNSIDYSEKFKKSWDTFCVASDAYLNGERKGLEMAAEKIRNIFKDERFRGSVFPLALEKMAEAILAECGQDKIDVEFKDGEHMIGAKITDKFQGGE